MITPKSDSLITKHTVRSRFERWASGRNLSLELNEHGSYISPDTEQSWYSWDACAFDLHMEPYDLPPYLTYAKVEPTTLAIPDWPNNCDVTIPRALRFLADIDRPGGGQSDFNSEHLMQLADEIDRAVTERHSAKAIASQEARNAVYAILYDDRDRPPEVIIGEPGASARFAQASKQFNAHLMVKVRSNSRDEAFYGRNVTLASPAD